MVLVDPANTALMARAVAGDVESLWARASNRGQEEKKRGGSPSHTVDRPRHPETMARPLRINGVVRSIKHASDSEPRSVDVKFHGGASIGSSEKSRQRNDGSIPTV
jgi:hypothetical protein